MAWYKKSQESLARIILVVVVIAVILLIAVPAYGSIFRSRKIDISTCLASVIMVDKGVGTLACETDLTTAKKINKIKEKDEVKKEVADLMHVCWEQFGQGKYAAFKGREATSAHCFICSKFPMPDGVVITQSEFESFLKDPNNHYGKEAENYYTFLQKGLLQEPDNWQTSAAKIFELQPDERPAGWKGKALDIMGLQPKEKPDFYFISKLILPNAEKRDYITNQLNDWLGEISEGAGEKMQQIDYAFLLYRSSTVEDFPMLFPAKEINYAVVYYQISYEYWRQNFAGRLVAGGIAPEIFNVPPARVFIAPYEKIGTEDFDCEIMQG